MKSPFPQFALTFDWRAERGFPVMLFLCVSGSLIAHAATFFLFRVVYPQQVTVQQPVPFVSLLRPDSAENVAFLEWIDAEDPALFARENAVSPPGLAPVRYRPSFSLPRTDPLGEPSERPVPVPFPLAIDRLTAEIPSASSPKSPEMSKVETSLVFTGPLADRLVASPDQKLRSSGAVAPAPLTPATLLVGVTSDGVARFAFVQQTSGNANFDELAIAHVRRLSFTAAASSIVWGHVKFVWGSEVYGDTASAASGVLTAP